MSVKRRDNKNRVLRNGESQRPDGRYVYKYVDLLHKQRFLYSWKLEPKDKLPAGKKDDLSLREKIRQVEKDRLDGIDPDGAEMTVLELVKLQKEDGRSYSSIQSIRGVLRPAFEQTVEDDYIRKNPFSFELAKVVINDSVTREAITREQMRTFLEFVRTDKHYCQYYDAMCILFHTGLRISEFVELTVSDLDMKERTIRVDHQLQRKSNGMKYIESTKTEAGTRTLPMEENVYDCFQRILANRKPPAVEPVIDGYSGFLFFDKDDRPMAAMHWEKYFKHAVEKYNKIYKKELPKITPHVCRHTYCTNKAKSGMNPKTLQYLMGHSDISVTMNTYTHLGLQDAWEELQRLQLEYSQRALGLKKDAPALKLVKTA